MSLKLINESFDKMYQEAISPEAKADSDTLRKIPRNHRDDAWDRHMGREVTPISKEEQDVLDKHDLKYDELTNDVYPAEYEVDHKNTHKNNEFGIDNNRQRLYHLHNTNIDLTNIGRKRLQRVRAGSSNPYHGDDRTSDTRDRLKDRVAELKSWIAVDRKHNLDTSSDERKLKIAKTKLDKENQSLRQARRENSYQNYQRKLDNELISANVDDFKSSKRELKWADRRDNDIRKSREDETRRFMDRMKDIDKQAASNEEERQWHKNRINTLLRRNKK